MTWWTTLCRSVPPYRQRDQDPEGALDKGEGPWTMIIHCLPRDPKYTIVTEMILSSRMIHTILTNSSLHLRRLFFSFVVYFPINSHYSWCSWWFCPLISIGYIYIVGIEYWILTLVMLFSTPHANFIAATAAELFVAPNCRRKKTAQLGGDFQEVRSDSWCFSCVQVHWKYMYSFGRV